MTGKIETDIPVDIYRSVVFPNRIREQRIRNGFPKLHAFSNKFQGIAYIRLSKIERGEVFARVDELRLLAHELNLTPEELLINVEEKNFDIGSWYEPFVEGAVLDSFEESRFAYLLAAAVRAKRAYSDNLTAAVMARQYSIPAVILSRIENAHKGLSRWTSKIIDSLCRLFSVDNEIELRALIFGYYANGELEQFLDELPSAKTRIDRTRVRIAGLFKELNLAPQPLSVRSFATKSVPTFSKLLPVFGSPMADGLIAMTPTGLAIEAVSAAGSRSYGLRLGRSTLGGGLPGNATVIIDPDRFPQAGGLALVKEGDGYRILSVAVGTNGSMVGYSVNPPLEVPLDDLAPSDLAAVIAAVFI